MSRVSHRDDLQTTPKVTLKKRRRLWPWIVAIVIIVSCNGLLLLADPSPEGHESLIPGLLIVLVGAPLCFILFAAAFVLLMMRWQYWQGAHPDYESFDPEKVVLPENVWKSTG